MTKRIVVMFMGLMLSSLGTEEEAQTLINQADQASQFGLVDAQALIQSLKGPVGKVSKILKEKTGKACADAHSDQPSAQCGMNLKSQITKKSPAEFYIFVSASMPQESIKVLGQHAQMIGAHVVFQGLVGGSFPKMQSYMKDLGIAVEIDPPKFEDYKVTVVPTFVLVNKNVSDRVSGHISIFEALDQFRKKGELKTEAQSLYQTLQGKEGES
jgi:type-F conjugative transfer system pilin assembly protein TrbC